MHVTFSNEYLQNCFKGHPKGHIKRRLQDFIRWTTARLYVDTRGTLELACARLIQLEKIVQK